MNKATEEGKMTDAEMKALAEILTMLEELSAEAQRRVLNWAWDRFVQNPPEKKVQG